MFINLMPHPLVIRDAAGGVRKSVAPSGATARVSETNSPAGYVDIEGTRVEVLNKTFTGEVKGLPAQPAEGVTYFVPLLTAVAAMAAGRSTEDLLVPGVPTRDENGTVNGCRSLARLRRDKVRVCACPCPVCGWPSAAGLPSPGKEEHPCEGCQCCDSACGGY